jgi:hypothetical protein
MKLPKITLCIPLLLILILISCSSSKKNSEEQKVMTDKPEYTAPLAPGTAVVRGEVLDIIRSGEDLVCRIEIIEVTAYGASTPELHVAAEISVYIRPDLSENHRGMLTIGNEIGMHISHTTGLGDVNYWSLIKISDSP